MAGFFGVVVQRPNEDGWKLLNIIDYHDSATVDGRRAAAFRKASEWQRDVFSDSLVRVVSDEGISLNKCKPENHPKDGFRSAKFVNP